MSPRPIWSRPTSASRGLSSHDRPRSTDASFIGAPPYTGRRRYRQRARCAKPTGSSQMPICITGMHRSGTSLVAQLLGVCGVDLGPEGEFFPANEFNADGYWENTRFTELGDAVLETL